jgi:hypothetical protein
MALVSFALGRSSLPPPRKNGNAVFPSFPAAGYAELSGGGANFADHPRSHTPKAIATAPAKPNQVMAYCR